MSMADFARQFTSGHEVTKPIHYYEKYDEFFEKYGIKPKTILEIGVFQGESTKILANCFPDAKIVGLDLTLRDIDFSEYKNVTYLQCDQADKEKMSRIIASEFPEGIDLVIEDGAHIGALSAISFETVFPHLKSGGLFIIEDWGTGYWDTWFDGGRYQQYPLNFFESQFPLRMPSHDCGMVGFVKSLVDYTHESAIRVKQTDPITKTSRLKLLQFAEGVCFALKA